MTVVDQRRFAAPLPVRAAFRALEPLAPGLGARWAERLWFTLPRTVAPSGADPVPGAGFTVDVGGRAVAGTTWGEGPPVYLMHGWAGHAGQLAAFVAPLVAHGHRVVALDAPSHGASGPGEFGPRSSSLPEFVRALTAVVAAHGRAHAVVAHSFGATAAAAAWAGGAPTGRLALLAPMAGPARYAWQFTTALGGGRRIHGRLLARAERRIGAPMHQFDVPELGRCAATPPTLIAHDREDTFMPVGHGTAIAAAWPGSALHLTSGLGHRRLLRDPGVVGTVVRFVTG